MTMSSASMFLEVFISGIAALALAGGASVRLWMTGWQSGTATFYGVRVDPDFEHTQQANAIDSAYTNQVIGCTVGLILLFIAAVHFIPDAKVPQLVVFAMPLSLMLQQIAMHAFYWRARQKVLPFAAAPDTIRVVDLANFIQLSPLWKFAYWTAVLLPFAVLAATAFYLHANFSLLSPPRQLPSLLKLPPLGSLFNTLEWTRSAVYGIYRPLVTGTLVNLTAVLVAYAFNFRSRISEWGAEVGPRWSYRKLLMSRLATLQWLSTLRAVLQALYPLAGTAALPISTARYMSFSLAWSFVWVILSLFLLFKIYRSRPQGVVDTASDQSWKLGQYYTNRDDAALIVPTRFGVGHTLNFGQPMVWAITLTGLLALLSPWVGKRYLYGPSGTIRTTSRPLSHSIDDSNDITGSMRMAVATNNLRRGDKDAARTIVQLANTHRLPGILNNAAYALAIDGRELPSARSYAEEAVRDTEIYLQSIQPTNLQSMVLTREVNLAMYWDTLGWVCYRQQDIDCAERYLRAAWQLNYRALFASHLAEVEHDRGKTAEAIALQEQALGTFPRSNERKDMEGTLARWGVSLPKPKPRQEIPLPGLTRRIDTVYIDALFTPGVTMPVLGNESQHRDQPLTDKEQRLIASALPRLAFPDSGPEHILLRVRIACFKSMPLPCTIFPYAPDQALLELVHLPAGATAPPRSVNLGTSWRQ